MKRPFLNARWKNLIMVNYKIDPSILQPFLPAHTELDEFNGKVYVSVVGFLFAETRILGFTIPMHVNFEEVNLRFYVKHKDNGVWKRGVVFIREIVPKAAITIVANMLYRENYCTMPMTNTLTNQGKDLSISYEWRYRKKWNKLSAVVNNMAVPMEIGSEEEFIAEHYFGYARYSDKTTFEYAVAHPRWELYPLVSFDLDCDFTALYGASFAFLQNTPPSSVFVAKGSEVTVSDKRILK
jgi:uncharacterized protein YqjF (DUF2071 family)